MPRTLPERYRSGHLDYVLLDSVLLDSVLLGFVPLLWRHATVQAVPFRLKAVGFANVPL